MTKITFIGDIHSAADDLQVLLRDPVICQNKIVFIGDYIDGKAKRHFSDHTETNVLDPLGVLDILMDRVARCGDVALLGNHDELWVATAKQDGDGYAEWREKAGHQLADKLGITATKLVAVAAALNAKPLRRYTQFLESLPLTWSNDRIVAVHAGLNWRRPFRRQRKRDLLAIRGDYYFEGRGKHEQWHHNDLGKIIVTGHTPVQRLGVHSHGYIKMQANAHDVPRYLINDGSRSKRFDSGIFALTLNGSGKIVQTKKVINGVLYDGEQKVTEAMVSRALRFTGHGKRLVHN